VWLNRREADAALLATTSTRYAPENTSNSPGRGKLTRALGGPLVPYQNSPATTATQNKVVQTTERTMMDVFDFMGVRSGPTSD
jgi:hypothetical protein